MSTRTIDTDRLASSLDAAIAGGLLGAVATVSVDGETVFADARGVRTVGETTPMTTDTLLAIFSMTKAVTGAAAMQCVERGLLSLDAPAADVLPELRDLQVLEGFAADGTPQLRPARGAVTLRNLLTHTSGFVYGELWNAEIGRYMADAGTPSLFSLQKAALQVPLAFDPGARWEYGTGIDWAGLMVEAVTGQTLGAFCTENIFGPLGMVDTSFAPTDAQLARHASVHLALPDGGWMPFVSPPPEAPEFEMGGGGLHGTVGDYLRFTNMVLGGGELDGVRVLQADTVAEMSRNNIGDVSVAPLATANPALSADTDFYPGQRCTWGLTFLINEEPTPQGRPAGSLAWAGLANSYYWIDPVNRICGVWATQVLPFFHGPSIEGFRAFESAVYGVG